MAVKYVLALLSGAFFIAAMSRLAREGGKVNGQSRTWLLIGAIFAAVSAWLFFQTDS